LSKVENSIRDGKPSHLDRNRTLCWDAAHRALIRVQSQARKAGVGCKYSLLIKDNPIIKSN